MHTSGPPAGADGRVVVAAGALVRDGRILAARRTEPPHLAGGWELPGGRVEPGETDEQALVRELYEELGARVVVGRRVGGDWPLGPYVMRLWVVTLADGSPEPAAVEQHDAITWVDPADLDAVAWLPGDREPATQVAALLLAGEIGEGR
jgi:8-oxo-dGTP diphosphatase